MVTEEIVLGHRISVAGLEVDQEKVSASPISYAKIIPKRRN